MKKVKIEIKSIFGKVLFTYECDNNTVKKTVLEAIENSANLRSADLRFADLSFADLHFADLSFADLSFADLSFADLHFADLSFADLSFANLRFANLRFADLSFANLSFANLSSADLRFAENIETAFIPINCCWSHSIKGDKIQIGCKEMTIKEWDQFFKSDEVFETSRDTEKFKQIQAVYLANRAYLKHLNKK